jgi:hypothetical protein
MVVILQYPTTARLGKTTMVVLRSTCHFNDEIEQRGRWPLSFYGCPRLLVDVLDYSTTDLFLFFTPRAQSNFDYTEHYCKQHSSHRLP